ncbi:MAG: hypothetical protein AAF518_00835 [Spirochaetota bacterium]
MKSFFKLYFLLLPFFIFTSTNALRFYPRSLLGKPDTISVVLLTIAFALVVGLLLTIPFYKKRFHQRTPGIYILSFSSFIFCIFTVINFVTIARDYFLFPVSCGEGLYKTLVCNGKIAHKGKQEYSIIRMSGIPHETRCKTFLADNSTTIENADFCDFDSLGEWQQSSCSRYGLSLKYICYICKQENKSPQVSYLQSFDLSCKNSVIYKTKAERLERVPLLVAP